MTDVETSPYRYLPARRHRYACPLDLLQGVVSRVIPARQREINYRCILLRVSSPPALTQTVSWPCTRDRTFLYLSSSPQTRITPQPSVSDATICLENQRPSYLQQQPTTYPNNVSQEKFELTDVSVYRRHDNQVASNKELALAFAVEGTRP